MLTERSMKFNEVQLNSEKKKSQPEKIPLKIQERKRRKGRKGRRKRTSEIKGMKTHEVPKAERKSLS